LTSLVSTYGYGLVFGLILLESAGLPLPGETMLVITAAYAATGHLSLLGIILSAAFGAILGDMGGYWIGRRGGTAIVKRFLGQRYKNHLAKGHIFFNRYGAGAVFLARFVPVVRVVGANLAGMMKMRFQIFTLFNAAGGIAWSVMMGTLGYLFGNNLPLLDALLHRLGIGLLAAILVIAGAVWISRRIAKREQYVHSAWERLKNAIHLDTFQRWLARQTYSNKRLALILAGGLLLAALAGWVFGALAEDVLARDSITLYDAAVGHWVFSLATEDSSQFFFAITLLGSTWVILPASLLLGGWLIYRKRWLHLGALAFSVGGGTLLNVILKNIFLRPRPDFVNAFYHESGYSFPSGHAMISVLFYGMAAYLLARGMRWQGRVRLGVTVFTLALLIGFSRIFLGVHFLTDVLGGWAAGIVWLTVCVATLEAISLPRSHPAAKKSQIEGSVTLHETL